MSDMFDALLGNGQIDPAELAQRLRGQQQLGTVASMTGIPGLQKLGPQMINQAAQGAQDYATLDERRQNQGLQRSLQALQIGNMEQSRKDALAQAATLAAQHNEVMRSIGAGHDAARMSGSGQALTQEEQDAMTAATKAGLVNPDRVNSRNQKYLAQLFLSDPTFDTNKAAQEGALMRNVPTVMKQQLLTQIPTVLKSVVDAGTALNFSDNRLAGSLELLKAKYSNDPKYTKYMALRNDSLMAIGNAMRGQGMSDFATKLEEEAHHPTQSPRALQGWFAGQMTALGPKIELAHKILRDIPTQGSAPVGVPAAASAGRTITRTGKNAQGQKVAQYSDGTIEVMP